MSEQTSANRQHIRHVLPLLLAGVVLGYALGRREHAESLAEISQYRNEARDARRNANALRWQQEQRNHAHE